MVDQTNDLTNILEYKTAAHTKVGRWKCGNINDSGRIIIRDMLIKKNNMMVGQ
jgi:hypothetical protein